MRRLGRDDQLLAEYAHASSAIDHYLRGRLLTDAAEYRAALQLDPKMGWAHAALGDHLLADGAYADAMREFASALRTPQHDDTTLLHYTYAAIASGQTGDAHVMVDRAPVWHAKWLLAVAEKKWAAAKRMIDDDTHGRVSPASWSLTAQLHKMSEDWMAYKESLDKAAIDRELEQAAAELRFHDAIESGDWSSAVKRFEAMPYAYRDDRMRLYAAAAAMLAGDSTYASMQIRAMEKDREIDAVTRNNASALARGDERSANKAMHTDITRMKDAYFFLGAHALAHGDHARAKELFRRSAASSFDLAFPMLAAQRLASL